MDDTREVTLTIAQISDIHAALSDRNRDIEKMEPHMGGAEIIVRNNQIIALMAQYL